MRALVIIVAMSATPAFAHQTVTGWTYPTKCCGNKDCRVEPAQLVQERPDGYHLKNGEIISYADTRVRNSGDDDFHICSVDGKPKNATICLFRPFPGF